MMPIDFSSPYTSSWRVMKVNSKTWENEDILPYVRSASLQKDVTDDYPLIETGTLDLTLPIGETYSNGWYRLEMMAHQNGEYERIPISTLYYQMSSIEENYGRDNISVSGTSSLYPASDKKLMNGDYAPKGVNGMLYAADRLRKVIPAPVHTVGDGFTLNDYVVFDLDISEIEAVWKILDAGNHVIQIDGRGEVTILPKPVHPVITIGRDNLGMLKTSASYDYDYSEVPNVYYANDGYDTCTIKNEDPESRTSIQNRGWEKDYIDTSPVRVNGETLAAYAKRRLIEESTLIKTYKYDRDFTPGVKPFDVIGMSVPNSMLQGDLRIFSQSFTLGNGITVSESAGIEIREYKG